MKFRSILLFNFLVVASFLSSGTPAQGAEKKPNIIFILTDDLGYGDVGVFFQNLRMEKNNRAEPWHSTPKLDAMAREGTMLTQHYCAAPVCAPSRASLMLGVHQGHANVRDNQFDKALENNHTLATVLKSAGYSTAIVGKWGLQGKGKDTSEWPAYPTKRGFDYFFGYVRHGDGHEHYPKEGLYRGKKEIWENDREISEQLDKCYTADLFAARAKKYIIDQHATKSAKPFFIYLAFDTPHAVDELPTQAFPKNPGLKGGLRWLGKSGEMVNTANGKIDSYYYPEYANATYDDDNDPKTPEVAWPDVYKRYASAVQRIDDCVGDILETLKDLKIDDDTLVIFSSDNGPSIESYLDQKLAANFFNSFGPFDGIKRDTWEGGIRMPTIVWWPKHVRAGKISPQPSQWQDWMATFAEIAKVPAPARCDGVSLIPSLTGRGEQKPSRVYVEYLETGKTPDYDEFYSAHRARVRKQMQTVRIGNFQGVRYKIDSHSDDFEIYDVVADPQQTRNLAGEKKFAALQQQMKDSVLQWRRPDGGARRPYDNEFVPALAVSSAEPGVEWSLYDGKFLWVPELTSLKETRRGIEKIPTLSVQPRKTDFGILFSGYVSVPADGDYTLYLTADSRALLRIHEATVIDADFNYQSGEEKSGSIKLKKGLHPFRLYYVTDSNTKPELRLAWSSAGIEKQSIPASAFSHGGTFVRAGQIR